MCCLLNIIMMFVEVGFAAGDILVELVDKASRESSGIVGEKGC